jgi:hypothetical protein
MRLKEYIKMMKRPFFAGVALAALGAYSSPANATPTLTFSLTEDGCTGGCSSDPNFVFGTITLTQNGVHSVIVSEILSANVAFVGTGAGDALEFNIASSVQRPITISNLPSGYVQVTGTDSASTFGSFGFGITCDSNGCGPGGSHTLPGPLTFTTTDSSNLNTTDFIGNTGGFFFASDVIGPSGYTGNVAARGSDPVPEPITLSLLGTGLIGLSITRRKRSVAV